MIFHVPMFFRLTWFGYCFDWPTFICIAIKQCAFFLKNLLLGQDKSDQIVLLNAE